MTSKITRRSFLKGGLAAAGALSISKLPDVTFSPGFTFFIDLAHLGFMMLFVTAALIFMVFKLRWVERRQS